eukprot:TRINITY_DN62262_c0_g1_i1.p1 TRINITY_DN62262_c0_g1~~TRINITY_DN62262_c0_g1_i1.p1  ORF type:complete len:364 (+),score=55.14 TRINITY_DN62262_c0_g1_i1:49-1140(+)
MVRARWRTHAASFPIIVHLLCAAFSDTAAAVKHGERIAGMQWAVISSLKNSMTRTMRREAKLSVLMHDPKSNGQEGRIEGRTNQSLLFCYAFARTPHDSILQPWIQQVSKACDGWAAFSWKDDPTFGIVGLYSKAEEHSSWMHENEAVHLDAWSHFNKTGAMRRYTWFLHLDIDTFVVPSRLKKAIMRYPATPRHILTQGGAADGYFVALPQQTLEGTWASLLEKPECLDHVKFDALSGHENGISTVPDNCRGLADRVTSNVPVTLADSDGDALVAALPECKELKDTSRLNSYATSAKQRWCNRMDNTLLTCYEIATDCTKESVLKEGCGRKLPEGACVSSHFAALHPVKDAEDFKRLAEAFP